MAVSIVMPALEMAQETGKIISWLKKEGDAVAKGDPIAEIETDKVVLELEATADGVLAGLTAVAGDVVPGGKTIAWVVAPGDIGSRGTHHDRTSSNDDHCNDARGQRGKSGGQGFTEGPTHGAGTGRRFE